ncbi:MAG: DUF2953 domain-containing protein [Oscillospiraceae bacterium]|nr:DUF2953 domain-containing protein [Oscillospiraceae bacterium]
MPISACFDYAGGRAELSVRYLFLRMRILPIPVTIEGEKKKRLSRRAKKKAVREEKAKKLSHYMQTGRMALDMLSESRRGLRLIRRNVAVTRLKLLASVGGENAHRAAENYGKIAAALFPALGIVGSFVNVRSPSIYIAPNFLSGKTVFEASVRVKLPPYAILAAAGHIGFSIFKIIKNQGKNKEKVVNNHERTSSRG